jgi:hypothetical protein
MPTFIFAGKKNGNTPYLKEERSNVMTRNKMRASPKQNPTIAMKA